MLSNLIRARAASASLTKHVLPVGRFSKVKEVDDRRGRKIKIKSKIDPKSQMIIKFHDLKSDGENCETPKIRHKPQSNDDEKEIVESKKFWDRFLCERALSRASATKPVSYDWIHRVATDT